MRLFLSACSRRVRDSSSILVCIASTICCNKIILGNSLSSILFLKFGLDISESLLNKLDVLLALRISSIGMLKSNSQIKNISLKLLFHSKSLHFAFSLCFQSHLHSFKCLGKVFLS